MVETGWCRIEVTAAGAAVLELHGEHDLRTKDEVTAAFRALSAREQDVVLDLSRMTFVDSAIIHAIYGFVAGQTDAGRALVLQLGTESVVRRALEVVGLLERLLWAEDREDAIALVQNVDLGD